MKDEKTIKYEDPSFVVVGFSRCECTPPATLFGSNIGNSTYIKLTISHATKYHDPVLSQEHIYGRKALIEVDLSPAQFAQLLTTMNVGEGTPGTLSYLDGKAYASPSLPTKAQEFKADFRESIKETVKELKEAERRAKELLTSGATLKKAEKEELLRNVESVERFLTDHLPFIMDQFVRSTDKIVTEAKASVDDFVARTIANTGIEALNAKRPQLPMEKEK